MTDVRSAMTGPSPGASRVNMTSLLAGFALGAVLASFAWVQILPSESGGSFNPEDLVLFQGGGPAPVDGDQVAGGPQTRTQVIEEGGSDTLGDASGGASVGGGGAGGPGAGGAGGPGGSDAAPGVSADSIKLGATYVSGGLACDFLCEVRDAMEAVRNRVNRANGVHGRQLNVVYKADDWVPDTGKRFIENLIDDGVFALAVSPSSEGLNAAANAGVFEREGVPVVGADGLNNSQFINTQTGAANPWIWPVATATTTNVHIIMKDAWERSGSTKDNVKLHPAIVFGNTYRFGVEGAYAFNQAYKRLSGQDIPGYGDRETGCKQGSRYCGIPGDWKPGGGEDNVVKTACESGTKCNFILILLEPGTAITWMSRFQIKPSDLGYGMAGAQPLFTTNFGDQCKANCHEMRIWTGYNPPIGGFQSNPSVQKYAQELNGQKSSADKNNQFSMGGYIGMELLVQALEKAGKDLTRGKLVEALNSIELKTGLTAADTLRWSDGNKYANNAAHAFRMDWNSTQQLFVGFDRVSNTYVTDPWLGQDNRPPA